MTRTSDITPKPDNTSTVDSDKRTSARKGRASNGGTRKTKSFPTVKLPVELDHSITQGAFKTHFDGFRSAFFHTTAILGRFGLTEGVDQVHQYIIDLIENARHEVDATKADIQEAIGAAGGPTEVPRTAPNPVRRTAEVPAYVVRCYLDLFPAVDRLIDAIVYAESIGAIPWHRRSELLKTVPHYLRSPAGRFHSLATKLDQRQANDEANMTEAKNALETTLAEVLAQHREHERVDQKRPLANGEPRQK